MAVNAAPLDPLALAAPAPVIPVIVVQRLDDAVPLARALVAGGIRVLEVTMRTPAALAAIAAIAAAVPERASPSARDGRRASPPRVARSASRCCPAQRPRAK
jgi:2-dehydro-3-deoxyphosphogluconate aldolase/(4S)-4-hydroxy-2-oxoglutarate aldolase